jgi:hypothetical protein
VHLVRYEDILDTLGTFHRVLEFAGLTVSDDMAFAAFTELRRQEEERGSAAGAGAWRDEAAHAPMMRRLGYQLAGEVSPALTAHWEMASAE